MCAYCVGQHVLVSRLSTTREEAAIPQFVNSTEQQNSDHTESNLQSSSDDGSNLKSVLEEQSVSHEVSVIYLM